MFDLMKIIADRLEGTGYSVFFNEKNEQTEYPFIVFNLPNSGEGTNNYREDFSVEVDIWTKDQTQNITMTNTIKDLMDGYRYRNNKIQVSFFVINRLNNIADEDDKIIRSQLRIQAKTYFLK